MSAFPEKTRYEPSDTAVPDWAGVAAGAWEAPSWKTAAREYHETRGNRPLIVETEPERLARQRHLLMGSTSLERVWAELNDPRSRPAPPATVEALMFSLRRGVGALAEPASQRRLSELSEEQVCEVYARVQKFKECIAPGWSEADADDLLALWRDLGQDA
jgi:hypothetical protein